MTTIMSTAAKVAGMASAFIKKADAHLHYQQLKTYVEALSIIPIGISFALLVDILHMLVS